MLSVPIIDLAACSDAGAAGRDAALVELARACRTSGVFYLENHGVPEGLLSEVVSLFDEFFDLPLEERLRVAVGPKRSIRT
jgi:isopenicillin N synthase-like dioxygenase